MNIQFETKDKVYGRMTVTVEEADYAGQVEKTLKEQRRKVTMPGFRPGAVPLGLLRRMYGTAVKADVVKKYVSEQIFRYLSENKIETLGRPLPAEDHEPQDLESETTYTFVYDVAVAPEFEVSLSEKDRINYYKIKVDDALIDRQIDMFASRAGSYVKAEQYAERDMLKGVLTELSPGGEPLEGGLVVGDAIIMPEYVNDGEQKKIFEGSRLGDRLTVCPRRMYGDTELAALLKIDKEEAVKHEGDFSYEITEITRYEKHKTDQELFDSVYGQGACSSEEEFRERIADGLARQLKSDSDNRFLSDVRACLEKKVGKLDYPDAILKRIMLRDGKDMDAGKVEENYEANIRVLTWQRIREKLMERYGVKIGKDDMMNAAVEAARVQFAQYGMNNVPGEYIDNYASKLLEDENLVLRVRDRAADVKLTSALLKNVKLNEKEISLDDFNKMAEEN